MSVSASQRRAEVEPSESKSVPAPHFFLFSEAHDPTDDSAGQGHWRFVLESIDGESKVEAADAEPDATGERLELLAIIRGLEALDQPSRVTLVTGSRYVSRGMRFGIEQWRESGWEWERYGQMTPVKNRDLWKRIDQAMKIHRVECRAWRFDNSDDLCPPDPRTEADTPSHRDLNVRTLRFDSATGHGAKFNRQTTERSAPWSPSVQAVCAGFVSLFRRFRFSPAGSSA